MYEMSEELNSLSLFVGTGECNGNCKHCAGKPLRMYAPKEDGVIDEPLIRRTISDCYALGARYLSLSSSGEPTLSPRSISRAMEILYEFSLKGMKFNPINLYSNGIRIGEDRSFCEMYLPLWKGNGLTTVYVTVHDVDEKKNAVAYGIEKYPSLERVVNEIHRFGLLMRANLVLNRETIGTFDKFVSTVNGLKNLGVDYISAWPIRDLDDSPDLNLGPEKGEISKMEEWSRAQSGVRLLTENSREAYQKGKKLTLFPDGTLSSSWCN